MRQRPQIRRWLGQLEKASCPIIVRQCFTEPYPSGRRLLCGKKASWLWKVKSCVASREPKRASWPCSSRFNATYGSALIAVLARRKGTENLAFSCQFALFENNVGVTRKEGANSFVISFQEIHASRRPHEQHSVK
jgi:hypothetical protein